MPVDITRRSKNGKIANCAYKRLMTFEIINEYAKRKICMTLIRPVVTYACGTSTLPVRDVKKKY